MATIYLCNAFSLSMLDRNDQGGALGGWTFAEPRIPAPVDREEVETAIFAMRQGVLEVDGLKVDTFVNAIGHESTAVLIGKDLAGLGLDLHANRISVKLKRGDLAIIAQYEGPRLPEGATELPEGAQFSYWSI